MTRTSTQIHEQSIAEYADLHAYILEMAGVEVLQSDFLRHELSLTVDPSNLLRLVGLLKESPHCLFQCLVDIAGVDYPDRIPRFEVVYHFLSLRNNKRVRIKTAVADGQSVPSLTSLYPSANWWEREVWDLYGIPFSGHPDLRRILTDYDFKGHPLRKDFPVTGFVELRYDEAKKSVVYEPVKLPQDFRNFDFLSPWEGTPPAPPMVEEHKDASTGGSHG
jgi:NADH-quinone oxidoreductase subunit C